MEWNLNSYFLYLEPIYLCQYSDSVRAGRSGDRILLGARFSAPVHTGSEAHTVSYTTGTGSFPGLKRPGRGVDHPPHLAPRLKKENRYTSSSGPSWPILGWTLLYFYFLYLNFYHTYYPKDSHCHRVINHYLLNKCNVLNIHFFQTVFYWEFLLCCQYLSVPNMQWLTSVVHYRNQTESYI
jgi:hypothetical protein